MDKLEVLKEKYKALDVLKQEIQDLEASCKVDKISILENKFFEDNNKVIYYVCKRDKEWVVITPDTNFFVAEKFLTSKIKELECLNVSINDILDDKYQASLRLYFFACIRDNLTCRKERYEDEMERAKCILSEAKSEVYGLQNKIKNIRRIQSLVKVKNVIKDENLTPEILLP